MAKSTKTPKKTPVKSGDYVVIFSEKHSDRKACTTGTLESFKEFSPDAGEYVIESEHSTLEEAIKAIESKLK